MKFNQSALIVALLSFSLAVPVFSQADNTGDNGGDNGGAAVDNGGGGGFGGGGFGGGGGGFGGGGGGRGGGRGGRGGGRGRQNFQNNDPNAPQDQNGGGGGGGGRGGRGGRGNRQNQNNTDPNATGFGGPQGGGRRGGGGAGGNFAGRTFTGAFNPVETPDDYQVLNSISIFARDRVVPGVDPGPAVIQRGGPTPVFVGALKDDHGYAAFISTTSRDGTSRVDALHVGDQIQWDGSNIKDVTMDKLTLSNGKEIPLGNDLNDQPAQVVPTASYFQSQDIGNRGNPNGNNNNNNNFGNNGNNNGGGRRGGRGGGGGFGGGGGGFGGGGGGFGGGGGGFGGGGGGGFGGGGFGGGGGVAAPAAPAAPIITSDPVLPAGSADDIEQRLRARRAAQVGGGG